MSVLKFTTVHGYSAKHDRWIRKSEIKYKPVASSIPDEQLSLLNVLACAIKQKLVPSRSHDAPGEVLIT